VKQMGLTGISLWVLLAAFSVGVFGVAWSHFKPKPRDQKRAVLLGLFLAVFDFVFQNAGAWAGYWVSKGSVLWLVAVPVEVSIIAFCAGGAFALLFNPREVSLKVLAVACLAIAATGALVESILTTCGLLVYSNGWTSAAALVSYWAAFILIALVNSSLGARAGRK